jgi:hypothetical protein
MPVVYTLDDDVRAHGEAQASRTAPIPDLSMQDGQLLAHGGADISPLEPVQYRHLEIRHAPTLAEWQKGAAGSDRYDRDSRHAVDQLEVDDDQRAVG